MLSGLRAKMDCQTKFLAKLDNNAVEIDNKIWLVKFLKSCFSISQYLIDFSVLFVVIVDVIMTIMFNLLNVVV